jgi:hypothetical protein
MELIRRRGLVLKASGGALYAIFGLLLKLSYGTSFWHEGPGQKFGPFSGCSL